MLSNEVHTPSKKFFFDILCDFLESKVQKNAEQWLENLSQKLQASLSSLSSLSTNESQSEKRKRESDSEDDENPRKKSKSSRALSTKSAELKSNDTTQVIKTLENDIDKLKEILQSLGSANRTKSKRSSIEGNERITRLRSYMKLQVCFFFFFYTKNHCE